MHFFSSFFFCFFLCSSLYSLESKDIPIHACSLNKPLKKPKSLAIATIFRDEGSFLKEWIEYHRMQGVSHFYLYNNCSKDGYWEVLKPYIQKGVVELFDVPFDSSFYLDNAETHNFVQVCCYNHALQKAKALVEWVAIIDSDEFIVPVKDSSISKALQPYSYADGIVVYWQIYGTSNVWELKNKELLIEKLLYKANQSPPLFKSIVKPKNALAIDPHWTKVPYLFFTDHTPFSHSRCFKELPTDVLRINHYTYRTLSFYELIKKPRRALWGFAPSAEYEKKFLEEANSVYDPILLPLVPKLKKRISQN